MPGRPPLIHARHPRLAAAAALVAATALAGCSGGAVRVPQHTPAPGTADACAALIAALPAVVDGAERKQITPAEAGVAAWGAPAILLRCGVPKPEQYEPTSELIEVNGVAWLPVPGVDGQVFFATGRTAWIRVDVPDHYAPEANALLDLAAAVGRVPEIPAG